VQLDSKLKAREDSRTILVEFGMLIDPVETRLISSESFAPSS
jgi:hypothetical protein